MAVTRIDVDPSVLQWALSYADRESDLRAIFGDNLAKWESGAERPTWRQLARFAKEARVPEAYMYGDIVPDLSIRDMPPMHTVGNRAVQEPSAGLVATIRACGIRQDWYREYADTHGQARVRFVRSRTLGDDPRAVAREMREVLGWTDDVVADLNEDNYREKLAERAGAAGVLVMVSDVVGDDPSWTLDATEFRGFALVDDFAPLVFVNGRDPRSIQAFTLAHELAHIWLGEPAVSAPDSAADVTDPDETWCNVFASELVAPMEQMDVLIHAVPDPIPCLPALAERFKIDRMVMLRALRHSGRVEQAEFAELYAPMLHEARQPAVRTKNGAPTQNRVQPEVVEQIRLVEFSHDTPLADSPCAYEYEEPALPDGIERVGVRFATALARDARFGGTLYRDAFNLLNMPETLDLDVLDGRREVCACS